MKKLTLLISFLVFFLASCAPEYIPTPPTVVPASTAVAENTNIPMPTNALLETPTLPESNSVQQSAIASLSSTLNLPADQIELVSVAAVIWPNGCMGVQRMGVMCTNQPVPGFVVVLQANGKQYEFHTNRDGSEILPAGGIQPSGSAQDAAKNHLASALGMNAEQITVVSDAEVE